MKRTSFFTFGVASPIRGRIQKITADEPREIMFQVYGNKWAMEYDSSKVTENGNGTATLHGSSHDYTYEMLPEIVC